MFSSLLQFWVSVTGMMTTVIHRSFPFRDQEVLRVHCAQSFDVMILSLSWKDKMSLRGLWMFQISTKANFETEVYALLKLFDSSWRELQALQRRHQETSRRFCETLDIALSVICSSNATKSVKVRLLPSKSSFFSSNISFQIFIDKNFKDN